MWTHRNKKLHDDSSKLIGQQQKLAIEEEFRKGFDGFLGKSRYLRKLTMVELLKKKVDYKAMWLRRIQTFRRERDELSPEQLAERLRYNSVQQLRRERAVRQQVLSTGTTAAALASDEAVEMPAEAPTLPPPVSRRRTKRRTAAEAKKAVNGNVPIGDGRRTRSREERAEAGASNQDHGLGDDGPIGAEMLTLNPSNQNEGPIPPKRHT